LEFANIILELKLLSKFKTEHDIFATEFVTFSMNFQILKFYFYILGNPGV
jgi:hypothetical protein